MKVLLLNPPSPDKKEYVRLERCMQKKSAWGGSLWQPLPLMYAQAVLDENGYETRLKDATAEGMNYHDTVNFVLEQNPDFLVVNTSIPTIHYDSKIALELKKKLPNLKTIAVGTPTLLIPSAVATYEFDFAIQGDVEYAILDIMMGKERISEKIKKTTFIEHQIDDLDKLPFPVLDDLNLDRYTIPFSRERLMLVNPGRGCPFNCIFCIVPSISGKKARYRNPQNFVDELERDYKKYNIKNFLFWTETITLNKKFLSSLCDKIIQRNLKIKWMVPSRVDTVYQELLQKMKDAGCWLISYGVESVDQKVLNLIKKGVNVRQIKKAVEMAHKVGIKVMGHVIIGLPGQTEQSIKKTIDWMIKNDVDYCQFYCAVPYWKTKLREIAENNNWIESNDPENYEIDKAVMHNEFLTSSRIEKLRKYAFFRFYFRPRVIVREITNYNFNLRYIANFFKDSLYFFRSWVFEKSTF